MQWAALSSQAALVVAERDLVKTTLLPVETSLLLVRSHNNRAGSLLVEMVAEDSGRGLRSVDQVELVVGQAL
jgi:hypothetical protein